MNKWKRFLYALQYFKIAWYGKKDITLDLLKQAKEDGNIQAYTLLFIGKKYFTAARVSSYFSPKKETYTFEIQMED